jgi:phosphotriesterase-related protein
MNTSLSHEFGPAPKVIAPCSRRKFLGAGMLAIGGLVMDHDIASAAEGGNPVTGTIHTVLGPIPAARFGPALAHEHVICDFIGAEQTSRYRWQVDDVVRVMHGPLKQLKDRGFNGFVDCTPAYIGRDPRILRQLARSTRLHIVTNTGYYGGAGDKYVPAHAYAESADQLADRWVREWEEGIEDTGVRPGFMKTGVDEAKGTPAELSAIDAKLVRATARTSKRTGLSVVCHTGGGPAGLAATRLFIQEGADPARFIVAHSDGHGIHFNQQVAALGAWVSFDAISRQPLEQHLKLVPAMLEQYADRLLLSHDNGWYNVGQPNGGEVRDFNYIPDTFLPALRKAGVSETVIRRLTVENPARALALAK